MGLSCLLGLSSLYDFFVGTRDSPDSHLSHATPAEINMADIKARVVALLAERFDDGAERRWKAWTWLREERVPGAFAFARDGETLVVTRYYQHTNPKYVAWMQRLVDGADIGAVLNEGLSYARRQQRRRWRVARMRFTDPQEWDTGICAKVVLDCLYGVECKERQGRDAWVRLRCARCHQGIPHPRQVPNVALTLRQSQR